MAGASRTRYPLDEVRARTVKPRDSWWTVLVVDPIAVRLTRVVANRTRMSPNQITLLSLAVGLGAAYCFWRATTLTLAVGAAAFYVSFALDCVDGKLARLTGTGSMFGQWLDYIFDRIRVLACAMGLMVGQFERTADATYLYLAVAIIFLDMLRYMDALYLFRLRRQMRDEVSAALADAHRAPLAEPAPSDDDDDALPRLNLAPDAGDDEAGLTRDFHQRFGWFARVRGLLGRHRIRTHVFSGIEFQAAIFVVAPLSGAIRMVVIVSAALLFVFEAAVIYKLYLSTKDLGRLVASIRAGETVEPSPGPGRSAPSEERA